MTDEQRKEVMEALHGFVIRVSDGKYDRMPAEVEALPAIVGILLGNY